MRLLNEYDNGNVNVKIFDDGTKIREWDDNESPNPIIFDSADIKITNWCDLNCNFCHEMSTTQGKHADLVYFRTLIYNLFPGTEFAIGGGHPLTHPQLPWFLEECKGQGIICNITVNHKHLLQYEQELNYYLRNDLIKGLGISISDSSNLNILNRLGNLNNVVYHVIAGVENISILDKIKESPVKKVLILGYKEVGRGINFYNEKVELNKKEWFDNINKYIGKIHLSFDNLAIQQLKIKRFFSDKAWSQFYCGGDGEFTQYFDLVQSLYSVSSTYSEKFPMNGHSIYDMFSHVRNIR